MRGLVLLAMLTSLSGCAAILSEKPIVYAERGTVKETGCPKVVVQQFETQLYGFGHEFPGRWTATGCGREWFCRFDARGYSSGYACSETPVSKEVVTRKVVVDRLALETLCSVDRIEVVSQTEWRVGTETAYRLIACGAAYTCTAAAGRVDCKKALGQ